MFDSDTVQIALARNVFSISLRFYILSWTIPTSVCVTECYFTIMGGGGAVVRNYRHLTFSLNPSSYRAEPQDSAEYSVGNIVLH
jgi:hypothetical protein